MWYIVCVDDRMGLLFGGRRLSRDRVQMARMRQAIGERSLYALPFSASLFGEGNVTILSDASLRPENGALFVEDRDPTPLLQKGDTLIVYRWGRHYPSDLRMSADLSTYRLLSSVAFAGSSHEEMLEEMYAV